MPELDVTRNYDDTLDLTEAQLDVIKESLETFFNSTQLDSTNFQTGGITTDSLEDGAVTSAKIPDEAITTSKVAAGAVTTAKIGDGQITFDKLADKIISSDSSDPGLDGISQGPVINYEDATAGIAQGTTLLVRDTGATSYSVSAPPFDGFSFIDYDITGTASTYTYKLIAALNSDALNATEDIPGGSVSITTAGRPVLVTLAPEPGTTSLIVGIRFDEFDAPEYQVKNIRIQAVEI